MELTGLDIQFEPQEGVFTSGKLLSGALLVRMSKPTKIKGIRINFEGKAESDWDTRTGKYATKYRGHETYLNKTMILFGKGEDTYESVLHAAGEHMYPFSFILNTSLPSSYEGQSGYVRYTCKATIDQIKSTERKFTVIRPLDLNLLTNATIPIIENRQATIEGCCFDAGTLSVHLQLNKSGYVPGEPIVYDITINNHTDSCVRRVSLLLRQIVNYTGFLDSLLPSGNPKYHTKTQDISLFDIPVNIVREQTLSINRATLIPSLPPSRLEGCTIIDISYIIILIIPCSRYQMEIQREIIIGTIPIREVPVITQPQTGAAALQSIPKTPSMPPPYIEPPLSYEECAFGKVDVRDGNVDEHTTGQMPWSPVYPFYDWSSKDSTACTRL